MNLDKLIEQYEQETGQEFPFDGTMQQEYHFFKGLIEWLANRPTCEPVYLEPPSNKPPETVIAYGCTYVREDLSDAIVRQYRIERDEAQDDFHKYVVSRQTCGQEQRKFLDEIEKLRISNPYGDLIVNDELEVTVIQQKRFESDLSKVIKGE